MNLDPLSLSLSQISYLVANLSKKTYKSSVSEISELVEFYGPEADRHLLRCLFSSVDFAADGKGSGKDHYQVQLLTLECSTLVTKPNFITTLCFAVDNPLSHQKSLEPTLSLIPNISKVLKFNKVQEVTFAIALQHSSVAKVEASANEFLKKSFPELIRLHLESVKVSGRGNSTQDIGLQDTAVEVLHLLLSHLSINQDIVTEEKRKGFLATLKTNFPRDRCPVVLLPLLYPSTSDINMDRLLSESGSASGSAINKHGARCAMHDVFREHGYSSCANVGECKKILLQYNFSSPTAKQIAMVLGMMATTTSEPLDSVPSLQSLSGGNPWSDNKDKSENINTWNIEVFMQTVKELSPSLVAREIMEGFDYTGFVVSDKAGFQLIIQGIKCAMETQDQFPIDILYQTWNNTHGQFSFLQQALMNSSIFCFTDYQCHRTVVDILKQPLDEENRDIANWKSLDLVERLLRLSEQGHEDPVRTLFMWPLKHCPDLLILSLLQQLSSPIQGLRQELISTLLPTFFGMHPNSAIILHYAWHGQGQSPALRQLVMQCMAEWYLRDEPTYDQTKLSRILDVAQDLKALSQLLSAQPFQFVIDLATLASRREYLKLDKWLTDKIREHGETFVQACITFLKRRCPTLLGGSNLNVNTSDKLPLPPDTLSVILVCLRSCLGNVSPEMNETIMTILTNCGNSQNKSLQPPPGVMGSNRGMPSTSTSQTGNTAGTSGIFDNIFKKPMDSSISGGMPSFLGQQSQKSGSNMGGPQPNAQNPLSGFSSSLGHSSAFAATGSSTGLSEVGSLHSIGRGDSGIDSVGPPSSSFSSTIGQGLSSGSGGLGLSGQSMGFGNQFSNQGFSGQNPLISGLSNLNIGNDSFSHGFGDQKPDSISRKVQDLFGQMKVSSANQPSSLGGGLGMGMGGSLDMFGSKKTSQAGGLNAAAQQAFQQAASKVPKQPVTDLSQAWPEVNQQFSKEVEDEANSYFQKIYNQPPHQTLTVDEILDLLKKFKASSSPNERAVFNCMMRNLFEEYKFFPQYPDKELFTTACLFGGIIEKNLVTYLALGIALRYVLEALRKPPSSKMNLFGIAALERFKGKLRDYPQYCQHINAIPHFSNFPPNLQEYVEYGQRSLDPPMKSMGQDFQGLGLASSSGASGSLTPTRNMGLGGILNATSTTGTKSTSVIGKDVLPSPSIVKSTNIDTLLEAHSSETKIVIPPDNTQDKIAFIFNNLSLANMSSKAEEMLNTTKDEYTPWLSQYFVMKRISIEPNFHQMYSNFLDCLKQPQLNKLVQEELKRNIKVLLQSDKIDENISDRSLLKNLGHFLGLITIAKNKPILFQDFDLRSLLYEAYHKGSRELLYVVPFVAKILESVSKSKIFRLPNPWTQALIEILVELHMENDLKLNLKFEVEVLCKNLSIDINKMKPTLYLRNPSYKANLVCQLSTTYKDSSSKPGTPGVPDLTQTNKLQAPPGLPSIAQSGVNTPPAGSQSNIAQGIPGQRVLPRFSFHDINICSISTLKSHLTIKPDIPVLVMNPALKNCIWPAVEKAVSDLLQLVVDRAIKIAMTTSEQIAKKDFALDPEEFRMRAAAHHMVRNLTAGMALITCREPLLQALTNNLKTNFLQALGGLPKSMEIAQEIMDQAGNIAAMIAADNVEPACCYIQKTAIEKAQVEMDKRMATEFELRKHARQEGRRYCDSAVLTYQAERMPEQIRLKVGGVTAQQTAVYEEFARNIPGFLPSNDSSQPTGFLAKPMPTWSGAVDEITEVYNHCIRDLDMMIQSLNFSSGSVQLQQLQSLKEATTIARNSRDVVQAIALLQKAVEGLLDPLTVELRTQDNNVVSQYRNCHVLVLKALQDQHAYGPQWTNKHVMRFLLDHRDDYKYNAEAVDLLIRNHFINMQQYDQHLSQAMENGLNYNAVLFAIRLVRLYLVDEKHNAPLTASDLFNTVETLIKLNNTTYTRSNAPEGLAQLIKSIRNNADSILDKSSGSPAQMMHSGISQAREYDDPPGLNEKTEYLLSEWVKIYHSPASGRDSTRGFSTFVQQMDKQGILRTDDLITRFFRLSTELCVDLTYRLLQESYINPSLLNPTIVRTKCFHTVDAFVRLITLLVKHSGDATNTVTKINLLNKVLGIVVGLLLQDHETRGTEFHQMPYHRILIMLFYELNAPEHVLESINFQTLTAFTNTYHILRPSKASGFAYAWLELISYRVFISRMLLHTPQQKGWPMYAQLLIDLFKFLAPFLRIVDMAKSTQVLYRGTLRLLLVLLHDFPEFLCDYHYGFCDVIPANCIQLRNLILSAFPRNMRLPDPFTPNLKVDMLQEINIPPRILTNFEAVMPAQFKNDLDSYLKTRAPVTFLSDLRSNLQISNDPGMKYSISLINSLVLYVGTQAIQHIHTKGGTPSMSTITHSSHMDIFQNLSVDLDTEGRYLFLNAIANQLRYPNSHTHYFSCTLLYLFAEANQEAIQEQITRVLLERLIVNRPHPWGLLITFIELIKNPSFKFWTHEFVHCAPDISKLFESVAKSCMGKQYTQQQPPTSQSQTGNGPQNPVKNQSNSPQGGTTNEPSTIISS